MKTTIKYHTTLQHSSFNIKQKKISIYVKAMELSTHKYKYRLKCIQLLLFQLTASEMEHSNTEDFPFRGILCLCLLISVTKNQKHALHTYTSWVANICLSIFGSKLQTEQHLRQKVVRFLDLPLSNAYKFYTTNSYVCELMK